MPPVTLPTRDERGVAMIVVVMLVVVCFTVVTVVASSSVFGTRQTVDDKSQLQALSAAEAGRDFALSKAPCVDTPPTYTQASAGVPAGAPTFSTTYYWSSGPTPPPTNPTAALIGCPPAAFAQGPPTTGYIGIESVGTAPSNGSSTLVTKTVMAWYPYTPGSWTASSFATTVPTTITQTATTSGGIAGAIVQGTGGSTTVDLADMQESGGSVIYNVTGIGSGASGLSCTGLTIDGNLIFWSSPATAVDVKCNQGTVTGTDDGTGTVVGTLYASGDVTIEGGMTVKNVVSVGGNVTVGDGGSVTGTAWAKGTVTVDKGSVGTQKPGQLPASLPAVFSPDQHLWTDYTRANVPLSDTTDYNIRTVQGSDCGTDWLTTAATSATKSTIVDATQCSSVDFGNGSLALTHDLTVLLPPSASFQGAGVSSADGQPHEFNLIQLDSAADQAPTSASACPANPTLKIDGLTMDANLPAGSTTRLITGLAYTPCTMKAGGSQGGSAGNWQGQLFAGGYAGYQSNSHQITYVPVTNVPGASSAGGFGPTTTTYKIVPTTTPTMMPTTTTQSPVLNPSLFQQTEP